MSDDVVATGQRLLEREYQVPFTVDLGLSTLQGVLGLSAAGVMVEWREYDIFDSPKGPLSNMELPWQLLAEVEYQQRWFGTKVLVSCLSASALRAFPLPAGNLNVLACTIKRRHRRQAEAWAAEVNLRLVSR
jgi:hypothetical protein